MQYESPVKIHLKLSNEEKAETVVNKSLHDNILKNQATAYSSISY